MRTKEKFTESELEEARYELWLMGDGPAKAEAKHLTLARGSLVTLREQGWRVLETSTVRWEAGEYNVFEAVVRRGNDIHIIRWQPFNKGWMRYTGHGWVIFYS